MSIENYEPIYRTTSAQKTDEEWPDPVTPDNDGGWLLVSTTVAIYPAREVSSYDRLYPYTHPERSELIWTWTRP